MPLYDYRWSCEHEHELMLPVSQRNNVIGDCPTCGTGGPPRRLFAVGLRTVLTGRVPVTDDEIRAYNKTLKRGDTPLLTSEEYRARGLPGWNEAPVKWHTKGGAGGGRIRVAGGATYQPHDPPTKPHREV